jgi:hypothetical protein
MDTLSTQELNEIAKTLEQTSQETMAVCPEGIFKEIYLPVFSGRLVNDRVVNAWIYLAGGPLKRVKVVDDSETKVLFEVPCWFSTDHMSVTAPKDSRVPSFGEVVAQALMCIHHSPSKAIKAFQESAISYLKQNININSSNVVHDEWSSIFLRYGITQEDIINNFKARIQEQQGDNEIKPSPSGVALNVIGVTTSLTLLEDGFVAEE